MKIINIKSNFNLKIFDDHDELDLSLVNFLRNKLKNGLCVFPGGETPKRIFKKITSTLPSKVILSDDRLVPTTNVKSNFNLIENFLNIKFCNNFPFSYYDYINDNSIEMLNDKLREIILTDGIELSLLGIGEDAHIASIFPFNKDEKNSEIGFLTKRISEDFRRYSLNYSTILSSKKIVFLVIGSNKSSALNNIFFGDYNPNRFPAQKIIYNHENIDFYCDIESSKDFLKSYNTKKLNLN